MNKMDTRTIIVLGGSFNPPTLAHKQLLVHALDNTGAGRGLFVPSSENYVARKMRRNGGLLFSETARTDMLIALAKDDGRLSIDTCEYGDDGRGHTYKTMTKVQASNPGRTCAFLLGADKLRILPKWHDIEAFLDRFPFVIMSRDQDDALNLIRGNKLLAAHENDFVIIPELTGISDVSSTALRQALERRDIAEANRLAGKDVAAIAMYETEKQKGVRV